MQKKHVSLMKINNIILVFRTCMLLLGSVGKGKVEQILIIQQDIWNSLKLYIKISSITTHPLCTSIRDSMLIDTSLHQNSLMPCIK